MDKSGFFLCSVALPIAFFHVRRLNVDGIGEGETLIINGESWNSSIPCFALAGVVVMPYLCSAKPQTIKNNE